MRLNCQKTELNEVLGAVSKAASDKTSLEVLATIRLRAKETSLELTGYDLELGIRTEIPARVETPGVVLVSARLFSDIIRKMPDGLLFLDVEGNEGAQRMTIRCGETECRLSCMDAAEYPELPDVEQSEGIFLPQALLKGMIDQTVYAVSPDETKPIFTGELVEIEKETLRLVALDNYRMAIRSEPFKGHDDTRFVVPAKALREIQRLLSDSEDENQSPCQIRLDQNHAIFEANRYTIYTRLLAGEFINYRRSIPTGERTELTVGRRELIESLERCALYITQETRTPTSVRVEDDGLSITCANDLGAIDDRIPCTVSGEKFTIGFNNRYLLEAVRSVRGETLRMMLTGPDRAVKIMEAQGDNYIAVVMPVQLRG